LEICLFQPKTVFLQSELKTEITRWKHTVEAVNMHLLLQDNPNRKIQNTYYMRKTLLLFTVLLFGLQGWATTFTVDGVTYTITDATNKTVAIGTERTQTAAISSSTVGTFTIPSSVNYNGDAYAVTAVGDCAFYNCSVMTSVTIPNTITSIGKDAFGYTKLTSIIIPTSVTSIGSYAFEYTKLTSIVIPTSVVSIGSNVFFNCTSLASIIVDSSNSSYSSADGVLFNKNKTTLIQYPLANTQTSYVILGSVASIESNAFESCINLTSITIPSSVTSIGDRVFTLSQKLTSITVDGNNSNYVSVDGVLFDKNMTTLIQYPCRNAQTSYAIPASVVSIGSLALSSCVNLTSITIPASVTSIGSLAFYYCPGLTHLYANNITPTNIMLGSSLFFGTPTSTCTLYVSTGTKSLYAAANQWKDFSIVEQDNMFAIFANSSSTIRGKITGSGAYTSGASCTLTASPTAGYAFADWTENGTVVSTDANYTFTVSNTHTFVANFTVNSYSITTSASSTTRGSVTSSGTYTYGSSCTLMATPSPGYAFVNWTENGSIVSTSASYTFTVNAARTLVANFAEGGYSISISAKPDEGGTVTGGGTYLSGTSQTITAIANTYYGFKNWTDKKGNIVSTSSPFTFTLSKDTTLTANFFKIYDFSDGNGLAYKISSPTTAYVTYKSQIGKDYSGFITIPSTVTYNGTSYNVTAIGDSAFHYCASLDGVNIPNSVVSIGDSAFYDCRGLDAITIPSFVTSIGNNAFYDCFNVSSITIPSSLISIGNGAFNQCSKITSITIPNTITSIGNDVFSFCTRLTSVTIPSSVTSIGNNAFYNCSALTSVTIPSSVTSIGSWTFGWCEGLTSVNIPNSITSIGGYAFYNCNVLTNISIPNSVTFIGPKALASCLKLSSITVDSNNSNYSSPDGVLFNKALTTLIQYPAGKSNTSYIIPSTVTSIGDNAFDQIVALLSVTIPNSISSIGTEAFYYSRNLNTIYVNNAKPQNINLRMNVFNGVSTSTCKLYVPTGSKTLYAAANQWKNFVNTIEEVLTPSISISPSQSTICPGSSVTFTATPIDGGNSPTYQWKLNTIAISGATNSTYTTTTLNNNDLITCDITSSLSCLVSNSATSIAIKMTVNTIVTPSLSITSSAAATYPGGSVTFTATPTNGGTTPAYQWYLNGTAISGATNSTYTSTTLSNNDVITCNLTSSLPCTTTPTATSNAITMTVSNSFSSGGVYYKITSLTTPYTVAVTNIGSNSYSGNIIIPSSVTYGGAAFSVTSIADYAFLASERLVSVTIPSSVTLIGKSIFYACSGLTSIIVDAANPNYYSDNVALYDKQVATLIECAWGKSGPYTIPSSVTGISESAFRDCAGLTSVTLPSSLTSIGDYAFLGCDGITSVTLPSSVTSIGAGAFASCMGITSIHVKNMNPSAIVLGGSGVFYNISNSACSLYVPTGSKSLYAAAEQWSGFNIVEEDGLYAVYTTASTSGAVTGSGSYISGSSCTLTASAATGYTFTGWIENGTIVVTNSSYTFTVNGTHTFVASFTANSYAVTASASTSGTVANSGTHTYGSSCTLTATPAVGYTFTNWTENGTIVSTSANYTFIVSTTRTLVANFTANSYAITTSATPTVGGTAAGNGIYTYGSSCTLTATPATGYSFSNWTENGTVVSTNTSYIFTISAARTLVASFTTNSYAVTTSASSSTSGTVTNSGTYTYGASCTLTATPAAGYTFTNWTENGTIVSTSANYTFTVNAARTIVANFVRGYSITVSANSAEGGTVTGGGTFLSGTKQTITATANPYYGFKNWTNKKGNIVSTSSPFTFTLSKDTTLTANFVKKYDFTDTNGLYYKISSPTTAYVTYRNSAGGDYSGTITIPSTVTIDNTNYSVTAIGDSAFYNCSGLTSINTANSVTSIGRYSFCYCSKLTSITLPDAITAMGTSAFAYCYNLASVTLSNSLTSLSASLFRGCQKLTTIAIPNSVTAIGSSTFTDCSVLTSATISASVVSIGIDAFEYCTGLTSITIENNNPNYCSVDGVLFNKNKTNLIQYPLGNSQTSYSVPNTVSTIGQDAFEKGTKLTSVSIPASVTAINSYAFNNCTGLTAIYASNIDPVKITLESYVFYSVPTSTCTLYVPTGSKTLYAAASQWKAFSIVEQENIYSIFANSGLTAGGKVAGSGAYSSGTSCTLTATPATGYTFTGWTENGAIVSTDLSYTFPVSGTRTLVANFNALITAAANTSDYGSVAGVGNYVIGSSCTLTATPTSGYAFSNWTENGNVVSSSATYTFTVSSTRTLVANFATPCILSLSMNSVEGGKVTGAGTYGKGSSQTVTATPSDGYGFKNWINNKGTELSPYQSYSFTLTKDTALTANFVKRYDFTDTNGLYYKISSPTTAYVTYRNSAGGDYSGAIVVPSTATINGTSYNVTAIGDSAFYNCSGLTSISIANSVTAIGSYSFYYCSKLTSITLPDAITSMKTYAFAYCYNLASVTLPGSLTSLSTNLFSGCSKLTSITISNSVTAIGNSSFSSCSGLTSAIIPASVVSIGIDAFEYCTGLTSITVENNNPNYYSVNGVLFNKNKTTLIQYPLGNTQTSYSVPNTVTTIGQDAFERGIKLTTVSIPPSVTSINSYALDCSGLTSIYANNSDPGKITLGSYIFYSVPTSTCTLYVPTGSKTLYAAASQWKNFPNIIEEPLYTISTLANISTGGKTQGSGSYINGSKCTLYEISNPGYSFANWTENGNVVSTDANYTFTVNADQALMANFTENNASDYTIYTSSDSRDAVITGSGRYSLGSSCTLTATANTGYTFTYWTENDNVISSDVSYTFTVNASRAIRAIFTANNYTISGKLNSATRGSIIGDGIYTYNTTCIISAIANAGYVFTNWTENGTIVSANSNYEFTVDAAHSLVANFSAVAVTVTQPTATKLSGNITVKPSTGFTYSIDGKTYQTSNEFPYLSIGTYNVTLKNISDGTVSSPVLAVVNASGLVAANNYQIKASNCTCRDTKDGAIAVTLDKALDYTVTVTGTNTSYKQSVMFSGTSYSLKNLPADTYMLVFKIDFLDNYEQSFNVVVTQPDDLSVLKVGAEKSRATYTLSGGTSYYVSVNDNTTETQGDQVQVSLVPGENKIKIYTEKLCQGMYEETIYNSENGQISLFPNPTTGKITIGVPGEEESVTAEIISLSGALQLKQKLIVPKNRLVDLDVSYFISGTYIVKVNGSTVNSSVKMMKK